MEKIVTGLGVNKENQDTIRTERRRRVNCKEEIQIKVKRERKM